MYKRGTFTLIFVFVCMMAIVVMIFQENRSYYEREETITTFNTIEELLSSVDETSTDIALRITSKDTEFIIINHGSYADDQYIRFFAITHENQKIILKSISLKMSNKSWTETGDNFETTFSSDKQCLHATIQKEYSENDNIIFLKDGYVLLYTIKEC